jgi:hypothetical protein
MLTILAIAAVLIATGTQLASAKPASEKTEKDLDRELCDLMGGDWWEDGSDYTCYFDDWYLVCEDNGDHCQIFCDLGRRCERIVNETYRQASLADDQVVAEPEPTSQPGPRGRGRSTPVDEPMVVAPVSTVEPAPIFIETPVTEPGVVVIDPA